MIDARRRRYGERKAGDERKQDGQAGAPRTGSDLKAPCASWRSLFPFPPSSAALPAVRADINQYTACQTGIRGQVTIHVVVDPSVCADPRARGNWFPGERLQHRRRRRRGLAEGRVSDASMQTATRGGSRASLLPAHHHPGVRPVRKWGRANRSAAALHPDFRRHSANTQFSANTQCDKKARFLSPQKVVPLPTASISQQ